MSDQDILEKAMQKAIDGGWDFWPRHSWREFLEVYEIREDGIYDKLYGCWDKCDEAMYRLNDIIFNHDFAKALWGEGLVTGLKGNNLGQTYRYHEPAWQYHLQQMVIADDPFKYIGLNIKSQF